MLSNKSRILVVDDFEMVRVMLKRCLNQLGYQQVDEAIDGKQALELVQKSFSDGNPYEMMFVDWNMPNVTGLELLIACRTDAKAKNVPIVMVTAESERQYVIQALQAGATDYVVKPFSQDTLQKKLEKISDRIKRAA